MSESKGLTTRLVVLLTPQFISDWIGDAGRRFRKTSERLSEYNREHLQIGDKVDQTPSLLWKAAEGATSVQHAKAQADYAKAENDRMEVELRRRTIEAQTRRDFADAEKAEAEAGIARVKEVQARIELLQQLNAIGVKATLNTKALGALSITIEPLPLPVPVVAQALLDSEELVEVRDRLMRITCPDLFQFMGGDAAFMYVERIEWLVSVGSRVTQGSQIAIIELGRTGHRLLAPATGIIFSLESITFPAELNVTNVLGAILPD